LSKHTHESSVRSSARGASCCAGAHYCAQHAPDRRFVTACGDADTDRRRWGWSVGELDCDLSTADLLVRDDPHWHEGRMLSAAAQRIQPLTPSIERRRRHAGLLTKLGDGKLGRGLLGNQLSPKYFAVRRRCSRHGSFRKEDGIKFALSSYHAQQGCRFSNGYVSDLKHWRRLVPSGILTGALSTPFGS